jgi:hypothetical protein
MKFQDIKIELRRKIPIVVYKVQAEIQVEAPAGIFETIVALAEENGGVVDETLLQEKFHFTVPMAKRALDRCVSNSILEDVPGNPGHFNPTERIRKSLKDGKIFKKESGEYLLFLTTDPLVDQQLITIQRSEQRDSRKQYDRRQKESQSTEQIPIALEPGEYQNYIPHSDEMHTNLLNSNRIIIDEIHKNAIKMPNKECEIAVNATLTQNDVAVMLQGTFQSRPVANSLLGIPSALTFDGMFKEILQQVGEDKNWDATNNMLLARFNVNDRDLIDFGKFTRKIQLSEPSFKGFGPFQPASFLIPVRPKSAKDCLAWEKHLLYQEINGICLDAEFDNIKQEIERKVETNCNMFQEIPTRRNLIKELEQQSMEKETGQYGPRPEKYWYLQAPLDLN